MSEDDFEAQIAQLRDGQKKIKAAEADVAEAEKTLEEATAKRDKAIQALKEARDLISNVGTTLKSMFGDRDSSQTREPRQPQSQPRQRKVPGASSRRDRILDHLAVAPANPKEISDALGENYHNVYSTLKNLQEGLYVSKDGPNWRITEKGKALIIGT